MIMHLLLFLCFAFSRGEQRSGLRRLAPFKQVSPPPGLQKQKQKQNEVNANPSSVECTVHFAVGHLAADNDGVEESDEPQEILHCLLDRPDEHGSLVYEIQGLEENEFSHIRDVVSKGDKVHRFEFPSATKSHGMPAHADFVGGKVQTATSQAIHVGKSVTNPKFQAVEKLGSGNGWENRNENKESSRHHRSLAKRQGMSTVLVVRTKAIDGETSCSRNNCRVRTFGGIDDDGILDDMNMQSQIDACSYGKMKFVAPDDNTAYPAVQGGVVTVELTQAVIGISHGTVLDWLLAETPNYAGDLGNYDHVMFFMPEGVVFGSAAAFGYVNGKYTWYRDGYSTAAGIQLHELGHNMGLGHSGEDGAAYGDSSCYMGYGGFDTKMCYNAAKSWYLDWYSELHQEFDPSKDTARLYNLVGLADYDEALAASVGAPDSYSVVLRIVTYESDSIFLTYNRQEKMNVDVKEFEDKVTVVRSDGPSQSWVEAALNPGQKFYTPIVAGSGMLLEVVVCDRVSSSPDFAVVSVHLYGELSLCTPPPPIPSWESYGGNIADGLVGYYNFDADFNDSSGNGHHGIAFGNPSLVPDGTISQALSFDGVDDYIELPNTSLLDFGVGDFTLTFWYRVSGDQSGSPAIIGNKDWSSGMNPGWVVSSNYGPGSNGDDLAINLADGSSRTDSSDSVDVDFNTWHFVAIRVKRGSTMSIIRSVGASYDINEDTISTLSGSVSSGPIKIGTSTGYSDFTKMDLDDLGIWSRALSSEEVDAIFVAGRSYGRNILEAFDPLLYYESYPEEPMPATIIASYDFEANLMDSSGNDLTGEYSDGEGFTFESTLDGHHLNLNNTNRLAPSFVTLPDSEQLDFGASFDFTISLWQRTDFDYSSVSYPDPSIISNKNWASGSNPGWTIGLGDDGRLEFNAGDGNGNRCDYDGPGGTMNDGEWHHVVFEMTRGSAGEVSIYLDGTRVSKKSCVMDSLSSAYPIRIGTDGTGGKIYPAFFTGDVDKVTIFGSSLSHANVFSLYSEGRKLKGTLPPSASPTTFPPTRSPTNQPTPSPTGKPTACPTAMPQECGCNEVNQADYRGTISITVSGVECQAWSSQSPHSHTRTPERYSNSGLDSNYCRNPDGEARAWCYTTGSTRWEYCDVPSCSTVVSPTHTPSTKPSNIPTQVPTTKPTHAPSSSPTPDPTREPTHSPTKRPSNSPTPLPSLSPTKKPSSSPTQAPTREPTVSPTNEPTKSPTLLPSLSPTKQPSSSPTPAPTREPTNFPTDKPSNIPTSLPTSVPTTPPTPHPTSLPTAKPTTAVTNWPTNAPTDLVLACPTAMPQVCGCSEVKQADYRGTISVTKSGATCQAWSSQTPYRHTFTQQNYPLSGLESNYCRNPDGDPQAWCYTTGTSRWEYCDVPTCPACVSANPTVCGCSEAKQADFRGSIAVTVDGEECQEWSSQSPHSHTRTPDNYPNSGLDSNYCRNPDGEPRAWCYTTGSRRWNYCNVPTC